MNRSIYKLLLFCMVSMLSVFVHAASLQVTYHIRANASNFLPFNI